MGKTETGRPRSPMALSPERPLRKEHAEGISCDMNNASAGPQLMSFTSARPVAPIHIPPVLDFLQPGAPFFSLPFGVDSLERHAHSLVTPFDGPTRRDTIDRAALPSSALPEPHEYNFRGTALRRQSPAATR